MWLYHFHNWLVKTHFSDLPQEKKDELKQYPPADSTIKLLGNWAYMQDMEFHIKNMPSKQKASEEAQNFWVGKVNSFAKKETLTYNELVSEGIALEARIEGTDEDEDYGSVFRRVLNNQLKEAIDEWKKLVEATVQYGYGESYEPYSHPEEFCDRRDVLEYAAAGIEILRLGNHLLDLPYYGEYCKRLKALDVPFKKLLNGETLPRPYADKLFWWRRQQNIPAKP